MNTFQLREKYRYLTPQERAKLFLSQAVPYQDNLLANTLSSETLYESYLMNLTESRLVIFGMYWLNKLTFLEGMNSKIIMSEDFDTEFQKRYGDFGDPAAALAYVLSEFDKEHGGWLQGIAVIMGCQECWDRALARSKLIQQYNLDHNFPDRVDNIYKNVLSFWEHVEHLDNIQS